MRSSNNRADNSMLDNVLLFCGLLITFAWEEVRKSRNISLLYMLPIFLTVLAVVAIIAPALFVLNIAVKLLFAPITTALMIANFTKDLFYGTLRAAIFPVRLMNDALEAYLFRNLTLNNAHRVRGILNSVYFVEYVIGAALTTTFILLPILSLLVPVVGPTIAGGLSIIAIIGHALKLNEWRKERLNNFNDNVLNRRWRNYAEDQEQIDKGNRNRARVAPGSQIKPATQAQPSAPMTFEEVWKQALATRNLTEVLQRLQLQFKANRNRVQFTPEMNTTYNLVERDADAFWGNLPQRTIKDLESIYAEHCDPISAGLMRIPVYITATMKNKEHKYYFDFITLLKSLESNNINSVTMAPIYDLTKITFDPERYAEIQQIVRNAWDEHNKLVLQATIRNDFQPYLEQLKSTAQPQNANGGLLQWTSNLEIAYQRFIETTDGFYGELLSKNEIRQLEDSPGNHNLRCGITGQIMRNPVYIMNKDGTRQYYDLLPLLHLLKDSNTLPVSIYADERAPRIISLLDICYDTDKKQEIKEKFRAIVKPFLPAQDLHNQSPSPAPVVAEVVPPKIVSQASKWRVRANSG